MNDPQQHRLLDRVRTTLRLKHMSLKTEKSYVYYVNDFIVFHDQLHPREMGVEEIRAYLSHLAVDKNVAASTQNVARNALLFLYKEVLQIELPFIDGIKLAKRPKRLPVVLTREEMRVILINISGVYHLMASLLYGSGLRLTECLNLRVKDIDFGYQQITVRDGKGGKDRVTMLPQSTIEGLKLQLENTKYLHQQDLAQGYGAVYLPYALERKYPNANREWAWQFVFAANNRSKDPRSGVVRRHHIYPESL